MKKIKLNTAKLQLAKERIASLTNQEMNALQGGDYGSGLSPCMGTYATCPPPNPTSIIDLTTCCPPAQSVYPQCISVGPNCVILTHVFNAQGQCIG